MNHKLTFRAGQDLRGQPAIAGTFSKTRSFLLCMVARYIVKAITVSKLFFDSYVEGPHSTHNNMHFSFLRSKRGGKIQRYITNNPDFEEIKILLMRI